jgi:ribose-phosphate pyrophosphokinase
MAERLGASLLEVEEKTFPDGEVYVRVPSSMSGRVAVAVFTGYPEPTAQFTRGLLLVEALRGAGASGVVAFPAYLPFSRQDKRFLPGEPISVRAVLLSLAAAGAEALATIDVHKEYSLEWFPGPTANVEPYEAFAEALRGRLQGDVYVVAPDRGALKRAMRLAESLGAPFDYLEKRRDRVTGEVTLEPKTVDVEGSTVVLVDDIASTGGTLAKAAEILLSHGASRVVAAVTHCLLVGNAVEKLERAGLDTLYCGNTVAPLTRWDRVTVVDLGGAAAKHVWGLVERLYGYETKK